MVGERGFEPPTPWSRTRCSTRLSHSPTAWLVPNSLTVYAALVLIATDAKCRTKLQILLEILIELALMNSHRPRTVAFFYQFDQSEAPNQSRSTQTCFQLGESNLGFALCNCCCRPCCRSRGRRNSGRTRYSKFDAFAPPRQAEE